jgi:hypothetical protein
MAKQPAVAVAVAVDVHSQFLVLSIALLPSKIKDERG